MEFLTPYMNYIVAALIIAALLIVLIVIFRMLNKTVRGRRGQRLGISEYHEIDKTRRLVLLRRDGVEHLVMIGGNQDLVIESGIESQGNLGHRSLEPDMESRPIPMRPPPRPAVFGDRRPTLRSVEPSLHNQGNQPPDDDQ